MLGIREYNILVWFITYLLHKSAVLVGKVLYLPYHSWKSSLPEVYPPRKNRMNITVSRNALYPVEEQYTFPEHVYGYSKAVNIKLKDQHLFLCRRGWRVIRYLPVAYSYGHATCKRSTNTVTTHHSAFTCIVDTCAIYAERCVLRLLCSPADYINSAYTASYSIRTMYSSRIYVLPFPGLGCKKNIYGR
jgi:hypothetical protein